MKYTLVDGSGDLSLLWFVLRPGTSEEINITSRLQKIRPCPLYWQLRIAVLVRRRRRPLAGRVAISACTHSTLQPQIKLPCSVFGTHNTQLLPFCSSPYIHQLHLYHYEYHQFSSKYSPECKYVCISASTVFVTSRERAESGSRTKKISINGVVTQLDLRFPANSHIFRHRTSHSTAA